MIIEPSAKFSTSVSSGYADDSINPSSSPWATTTLVPSFSALNPYPELIVLITAVIKKLPLPDDNDSFCSTVY
jgi:hypothetical protein